MTTAQRRLWPSRQVTVALPEHGSERFGDVIKPAGCGAEGGSDDRLAG
jgi:hypothetical protein